MENNKNGFVSEETVKFIFHGEICKDTEKYLVNIHRKIYFNLLLLSIPAVFIFSGYLLRFFSILHVSVTIIWCIFGSSLILLFVTSKNPTVMIQKIVLTNETIISTGKKFCVSKNLSEVKKVVDFGEFYRIFLKSKNDSVFVCQKTLLTKGTIEEFEAFFADVLVIKS